MRRHLPPSSTLPKDLPVDRHTIDILIEGVSRGDPHFDSLEFMLSPASEELPAIWRAHRPALLRRSRAPWDQATALGCRSPPGGRSCAWRATIRPAAMSRT